MRLSYRQQAMRILLWVFALFNVGRALAFDQGSIPSALAILVGIIGYEAMIAYSAKSDCQPFPARFKTVNSKI